MLNQPLLTPISARQDEAPVAPGFVVFLLYTLLTSSHSTSFSLYSDTFIDGLSTLTMQVYCFFSPACLPLLCLLLPHSLIALSTRMHLITTRMLALQWLQNINLCINIRSLNCTCIVVKKSKHFYTSTFLLLVLFSSSLRWRPSCKLLKSVCRRLLINFKTHWVRGSCFYGRIVAWFLF